MKRVWVKTALLLITIVLLSPRIDADQILLKNGDRLTGKIVKSDAKTLLIRTDFAGDVIIQWSAIDGINSTQPLHVSLDGGQMIVGPVMTADGKIQITTQTAGVVTTSKDSIQVIRSDSEQMAYDAEMDRLRNPHLTDFWSGFLNTGLSFTRGNSDTLNFALSGNAVRKSPRDTITAYGTSIFSNNRAGGTTNTTAEAAVCLWFYGFLSRQIPATRLAQCTGRRRWLSCGQLEADFVRCLRRRDI
jgi:hypothetical protein